MPYMPNNPPRAGFTIIELLFITPMVILVVAAMVGFAVSLTGDALIARERVNAAYVTQNALDRIEQDVRLSSTILDTSGTLPSPQGRNSNFNGTAAFATPATYLVLEQYATTNDPYNNTRSLVYYANQPYACGDAEVERNTTMRIKIIYYRDGTTLKRRVVVPSYTSGDLCATPWQRNSCKNGLNTSNQCRAADEVIASDVTSLTFAYYENAGDTTAILSPTTSTQTTHTTLTVDKDVAGRDVNVTRVMRASKLSIE